MPRIVAYCGSNEGKKKNRQRGKALCVRMLLYFSKRGAKFPSRKKAVRTVTRKGLHLFDVTPCNLWSQHADLNRGPTDYESVALPAELCWRIDRWPIQGESIACPRFKVKPFSFWRNKRFWGRLAAPTASGAQTGRKGRL